MQDSLHFTVDSESTRLDLFLAKKTGRSRAFVQFQIEKGRVQVNGEPQTKSAQKVKAEDRIDISFIHDPEPLRIEPVEAPLDILFEDKDLIVINKPVGWVVHPAVGHKGPTVVHYLLHYLKDQNFNQMSPLRPGIVHRLDKGTSGCLIIAKNRDSLENLSLQFKERELKKEYEALVWGKMKEEGSFSSEIGRHKSDRKKMSSHTTKGREAYTEWKRLQLFQHFSLVQLFPKTGRTHQLRVHLTEGSHPIVGDPTYGRTGYRLKQLPLEMEKRISELSYPLLHAKRIIFKHPSNGSIIDVRAPRPQLFDELLTWLSECDMGLK